MRTLSDVPSDDRIAVEVVPATKVVAVDTFTNAPFVAVTVMFPVGRSAM